MKMKLYAALNEVKMIEKKLARLERESITPAVCIGAKQKQVAVNGKYRKDTETFVKEELATFQSKLDLEKRLSRLKAAIGLANMEKIEVAGDSYTIYEALQLKSKEAVKKREDFLKGLKARYTSAVLDFNDKVIEAENKAYDASLKFIESTAEKELPPSQSEVKKAVKDNTPTERITDLAISCYNKTLNEYMPQMVTIKPDFDKWLDEEIDKFERFVADVDIAITEFNTAYEIEVED